MTTAKILNARALLFDLDGVLVDSIRNVELVWRDWATERGFDADQIIAVVHGRRAADTVAAVAPGLNVRDEVAILSERESSDRRGLFPIAGASPLIASLPMPQWAVVTSGTRAVATFRLGVGEIPMPNVLIAADDVSRGKPDPEGYLRGAALLGFAPSDCIVVEDAPAGIEAARAAGMRSIGIASTFPASALTRATVVLNAITDVSAAVDPDTMLLNITLQNPM